MKNRSKENCMLHKYFQEYGLMPTSRTNSKQPFPDEYNRKYSEISTKQTSDI
jgi:hypothetical protein